MSGTSPPSTSGPRGSRPTALDDVDSTPTLHERLRERLRALPAIVGSPPPFDPQLAPESPRELVLEWLDAAISAGVPEAHAATLSTVDASGRPDARVLALKDITPDGSFEIASGGESAKAAQLRSNPACALSFFWTPLARAIRIRGTAIPATADEAAADFLARPLDARAITLLGRQSDPIGIDEDPRALIADSLDRVQDRPEMISRDWTVWRIRPETIEFWQGSPDRSHLRLRYHRDGDRWNHERLWA
ncbi:pyridoxamine 5'-phosphate oxidase [Microbacterium resistens]|uniref:Pyridoxamine 5'-phosphate oxidase n=1 Tax=Microbacterium resistens TaxID=156977 RepID=A0ABU1SER7_9MICO|nr:pyridoxal 5'-phosphate synthase [Microbacterium resistens]MDR6867382.1 pyridoxamine 5'-phosphate oxidase [Microbacterium resistens]